MNVQGVVKRKLHEPPHHRRVGELRKRFERDEPMVETIEEERVITLDDVAENPNC